MGRNSGAAQRTRHRVTAALKGSQKCFALVGKAQLSVQVLEHIALVIKPYGDLTRIFVPQVTRTIRNHPLGYIAKFPSACGSVWNEKTGPLSAKINT